VVLAYKQLNFEAMATITSALDSVAKCSKYEAYRQVSEVEVIIIRNLLSFYCIVTYSGERIPVITSKIDHMHELGPHAVLLFSAQ
jgi:hypothetical protein